MSYFIMCTQYTAKRIKPEARERRNTKLTSSTSLPLSPTHRKIPTFIKSLHSIPRHHNEPVRHLLRRRRPPHRNNVQKNEQTNHNQPPPPTPSPSYIAEARGRTAAQQQSGGAGRPPPYSLATTTTAAGGGGSAAPAVDISTRRRLFAGFRPLSGFAARAARFRSSSTQNRSVSLPESNYLYKYELSMFSVAITYYTFDTRSRE